MTQKELLELIKTPGMIDYAALKTPEALALFPETLSQLLGQAEAHFEALLKMSDEDLDYETFIDPFFTNDEILNVLFKAIDSFNSTDSSDQTRKIIADFQPKLVDYYNKVNLSGELYQKLKHIESQPLSAHQKRSLELILRGMEVAGVHLPEEKREVLKKINKQLSELSEAFNNNVIDSKAEFFFETNDESILSEMPEEDKQAAQKEAKQRQSKSAYVFTLSPPSYIAIMRYCNDASVRELFYKANNQVACSGKKDNRPVALKILKLRQEKAALMGFKSYAEYILQERMAPSPEKVLEVLGAVNDRAGKEAENNIEALKQYAKKDDFEAWDLSYYAEKLKKETFHVDDKALKPYFAFGNVVEGLFKMIKTLFDVEMRPVDVPPYAPGAMTFEVYRNDEHIAYYFLDPFTRPEKRPGAWANDIRSGYENSKGEYHLPVVINVCNFPQPTDGKPSLLTHRDVETLFHEFGHAIHVMLSSRNLPNLNGFNTEWDFVEAPSQILENWCWEYEVLSQFATHYQTGEVIPNELVENLKASKNFMSGLFLVRQNEFGFLDYLLHHEPVPETVAELDQTCFEISDRYSPFKKFDGFSMYTAFSHIFAGGYSAGYYSYVWAEILEADLFEKAKELGILSRDFGQKYAEEILAPGSQRPPMDLFVDFTGHEPSIEALFKKHGIVG